MSVTGWFAGSFDAYGKFIAAVTLVFLLAPVTVQALDCEGGSITVCSATIPIPGMTPVGGKATVHVPASVLGGAYDANPNMLIDVQCVGDIYGAVTYQPLDLDRISCDHFPCQASSVRVCDVSVPVPGGTPLGGVVQMNMPTPYVKSSFTVQCVGSAGNPPVYQVTDHSAVTCLSPATKP